MYIIIMITIIIIKIIVININIYIYTCTSPFWLVKSMNDLAGCGASAARCQEDCGSVLEINFYQRCVPGNLRLNRTT